MQIRTQAKKIQLIRTHYKTEKKRTEGKVFKTFDICSTYAGVPSDVAELLNEDEVTQLKDWFEARELRNKNSSAEFHISNGAWSIGFIRQAIDNEAGRASITEEKANAIYEAMDELKKALKKAGFDKPVKVKEQVKDPRQADIMDAIPKDKINLAKD